MHLFVAPVVWWRYCALFDITYHRMSNTSHFRQQTTGTKNKCIDRFYIKVIDLRIRARMDKMTMNRPLHSVVRHSQNSTLHVLISKQNWCIYTVHLLCTKRYTRQECRDLLMIIISSNKTDQFYYHNIFVHIANIIIPIWRYVSFHIN